MSKSRFTLLTMKKIALRKSNWLASPEQDFPMLGGCLFEPRDSTLPLFFSSGWVTCSFISSVSYVLRSKGVPGSLFEALAGACVFFAKQVWWLILSCIPHTVPNLLSQTLYGGGWVFHTFFQVRKQIHSKRKRSASSAAQMRIQPSRRSITWQGRKRKRWDMNEELVPFTGGRDWISSFPERRAGKQVSPQSS